MSGTAPVVLGEYKRCRIAAPPPTDADEHLAHLLSSDGEPNARLEVRWLANGHADIQTSSWIGVVRFTSFEVHVVPKLVGGSLGVLRMLQYATDINILSRLPADRSRLPKGESLLDLVCLLLVEETQKILRDGLLRDYRSVADTLDVLRGRLHHREQMLRRYGQLDRIHCQFDEYDADTAENQYLAAALHAAHHRCTDPDIRFGALRLAALLDTACNATHSDPARYDRAIHYNRRNARYHSAHELAGLLLRGLAFDDLFDRATGTVNAFMVDMNVVFERFVTRLVDDALQHPSPLRSASQVQLGAVIRNQDTGHSYTNLRPDLVIEDSRTGAHVPIDIKYKLYDERKFSSTDIYQTLTYAYALGDEGLRRAGVVYPAQRQVPGPSLIVKPLKGPASAQIRGAGLDVPALLSGLGGPGRTAVLDEVRATIERIVGADAGPDRIAPAPGGSVSIVQHGG